MDAVVTFTPTLRVADASAAYWLRQVTVRLRREVSWLWHERGFVPRDAPGAVPPFTDRVQAVLDQTRFAEAKAQFFEQDVTARYLSAQLSEPPPAGADAPRGTFGWVIHALGLDDAAAFTLALGLAAAFDPALGTVVAACLNDANRTAPTLALAQRLWDDPLAVLPLAQSAHPVFRTGLLHLDPQAAAAGIDWQAPLHMPAPVAHALLAPGASLPAGLTLLPSGAEGALPASARHVVARLRADANEGLRVVPIRGGRTASHDDVARALAGLAARSVARLDGRRDAPERTRALFTVAWLRDLDVFVPPPLADAGSNHQGAPAPLPDASLPVVVYLGVTETGEEPAVPARVLLPPVAVPRLSYADRVACWHRALGKAADGLAPTLAEVARRFRYAPATIEALAEGLNALPDPPTPADVLAACRAALEVDLGALAQPVTPRFAHERLILPPKQARQFREVVQAVHALTEVHYQWGTARVWNEGGITALFAGPSGTGKTMAAEVLAQTLDLPMYRIDLSQVVNKYIGETEKNLKRVFDAADTADMLLFFDEADALFGKRTDVKDAHDRYANLEISYLLERMERFKGLAILATNRKRDLDEAFLRRLRYILDFPLPEEAERRQIWHQMLPDVDTADLDLDFLARQFTLTGGHIRSIVFNACLQSADGSPERRLTMDAVLVAVKRELDKLNRPASLHHFGAYAPLIDRLDGSDSSANGLA